MDKAAESAAYAIKPQNAAKKKKKLYISAECCILRPPHDTTLVPQLLWQIPH
jgi:hypothetical protein